MFKWRLFLLSQLIITLTPVLSLELYPYGEDDSYLPASDNSSSEIRLAVPLTLYDTKYPSVWVNNDGILTFQESPEFFNGPFPLNYPAIAPFYADIDLSRGGKISFRESTQLDLLTRIDKDISANFPDVNFASRSLLIVTFDSVGHYKAPVDSNSTPGSQGVSGSGAGPASSNGVSHAVNTFQLLIASDGETSFVQILYPSNAIQWIRGEGKAKNLPDAKAQAGFIGPLGQLRTLRASGTDQMFNLDKTSNLATPVPGVWLFGLINGTVMEPAVTSATSTRDTCSKTNHPCIPSASCQEKEQGTCCSCKDGYVGNGISCFPIDASQRTNGKVNGKVNDRALTSINALSNQEAAVNLHSYSSPEEGNSYTALAGVPNEIGSDLQSLLPINDIVGWLFAKTSPGTANGFMMTGGVFNRSVDIEFTQTGDRVTINERFLGPDVFNNLKVAIDINGSLRKILPGSKLELTEFIYDYKVSHNSREKVILKSKAARKFKVEHGLEVPFNIDQSISYNQCPYRTLDEAPKPFRLETTKNFVVTDLRGNETVVRFSGNYKILPALDDDPCTTSRLMCGKHSSCVVDNNNPRCICDRGFSAKYSPENAGQITCEEIDECRQNNRCHANADCFNTYGSYQCKCKPGFAGTGFFCQAQLSCNEVNCDQNAACTMNNSTPECKCNSGFYGNGYYCTKSDDGNQPDCREGDATCPLNSSCLPVDSESKYKCICNAGFIGDGSSCKVLSTGACSSPCGRNAICTLDYTSNTHQCRCSTGFVGNGFNCIRPSQLISCVNDSECHNRARCQVSPDGSSRYCFCNEGLYGDGKYCGRSDIDSTQLDCKVNNVCSEDASCLYNSQEERYSCECRDGFTGDGVSCEPIASCTEDTDCPSHGKCTVNVNNRGHCDCSDGYNRTQTSNGASFTCEPLPDAPCDLVANCHEKAECVYDHSIRRFECRCKRGYKGDGHTCDKTIVPCNILNTCDVHGQCKYNLDERRHTCQCLPGWEGDGHTCTPNLPCNERPDQCHQYADCVQSANSERHTCECRKGYIGDGLTCQVMPSYDGDYLIFSQGMSLLRLPLAPAEENPGQLLITRSHSTPVSLDVDCAKGHIYWSDVTSRKIYRAPYNGSTVEAVTDQLEGSPEGIAVDWVGRYIFWTDSHRDAIFVARLDATNSSKKLIHDDLQDPRDIAVHPGIGKIYWTDWNREKPKIEFSNMDGSDRKVLIDTDLGLPNMLTIDYSIPNLCWTDAELHRIECADLDGQNRRTMYTPVEYPFGITCAGNFIFWTDWKSNSVDKVNRLGGQAQSLALPLGGNGRVYDIVTVPKKCPQMSNACQVRNGGCEEKMCLPNSQSGRTCLCPDNDESCFLTA